jgi:hypothetical protein
MTHAEPTVSDRVVRIAGASACEFTARSPSRSSWAHGEHIDYLMCDELAELNVATMAGAGKSVIGLAAEEAGFARSFVDFQVGPYLPELLAKRHEDPRQRRRAQPQGVRGPPGGVRSRPRSAAEDRLRRGRQPAAPPSRARRPGLAAAWAAHPRGRRVGQVPRDAWPMAPSSANIRRAIATVAAYVESMPW